MEHIRSSTIIAGSPDEDVALIAIGDIHGRYDLLVRILSTLKKILPHTCKRIDLVFLGDIIDRGHASIEILDFIADGIEDWNVITLLGNHEQLLLRVLHAEPESYRMQWALWRGNGGLSTLENLHIKIPPIAQSSVTEHRSALVRALGQNRIEQINHFPSHYQSGNILCVHAGIDPNKKLADNFAVPKLSTHPRHWAWIRDEFLNHQGPYDEGVFVVHGHSVTLNPQAEPHRIGLDSGACLNGILSGALFYNYNMTVFQVSED